MPALAEKPEKVARVDPNAPWPIVRVKDVASSIQYGLTASAAQRDDGPRFLRITDIQDGRVDWSAVPSCEIPSDQISKYQLAAGDLVFARTGATTGKSFLIGECPQAVFASYLIRVRVTSAVEPKYLAAFFQSPDYWQQIEAGKRGIGQPNVNGTILGEVQFPLPPLLEQRRIVAEIEQQFTRLDAGVAALRRTQANLKRYRAAVLKAACEGRLVPTDAELAKTNGRKYETGVQLLSRILTDRRKGWKGRGKYTDPTPPTTLDSLDLPPEGWALATVEQLSNKVQYGHTASAVQRTSGVRFLRITDIQDRRVDWDSVPSCDISQDDIKELSLFPGDLVFARTGATVGKSYLLKAPFPPSVFASYLIRISPADECLSRWFQVFFDSPNYWNQIRESSSGIGQPNVNGSKLQALRIPLPPLSEQTRIIAEVERRLSVVDELEALVATNIARAARLRHSVLNSLFTSTTDRNR